PLSGQGRMWRKTHLVSADAKMLRILGQCRAPALERGTERRLRDAVGKRDGMVENRPVLVIQPGAAEQLRTVPVGENLLIGRFPVPFLARKPGVEQDRVAVASKTAAVEIEAVAQPVDRSPDLRVIHAVAGDLG